MLTLLSLRLRALAWGAISNRLASIERKRFFLPFETFNVRSAAQMSRRFWFTELNAGSAYAWRKTCEFAKVCTYGESGWQPMVTKPWPEPKRMRTSHSFILFYKNKMRSVFPIGAPLASIKFLQAVVFFLNLKNLTLFILGSFPLEPDLSYTQARRGETVLKLNLLIENFNFVLNTAKLTREWYFSISVNKNRWREKGDWNLEFSVTIIKRCTRVL